MMSPFIGGFLVFIVGGFCTGVSLTGVTEPEDAQTHEQAKNTTRDRVIIFFINVYYTITLYT